MESYVAWSDVFYRDCTQELPSPHTTCSDDREIANVLSFRPELLTVPAAMARDVTVTHLRPS